MLFTADLTSYKPLLRVTPGGGKEWFNWEYFKKFPICGVNYLTRKKIAIPIIKDDTVCIPNSVVVDMKNHHIEKLDFSTIRTNVKTIRKTTLHPSGIHIDTMDNRIIQHKMQLKGSRFCSSTEQIMLIKGFILLVQAINPEDGWVVMCISLFDNSYLFEYKTDMPIIYDIF